MSCSRIGALPFHAITICFQRIDRVEFQIELDQVLGRLADDEAAGELHVLLWRRRR